MVYEDVTPISLDDSILASMVPVSTSSGELPLPTLKVKLAGRLPDASTVPTLDDVEPMDIQAGVLVMLTVTPGNGSVILSSDFSSLIWEPLHNNICFKIVFYFCKKHYN